MRRASASDTTLEDEFMLSIKILLLTAIFAVSALASTQEGGNSSGGGSVVRDDKGHLVSADLYFKARHFKLPDSYQRQIDLPVSYPKMKLELDKLMRLIANRARNPQPFKTALREIEFYASEKFSGDDKLLVKKGFSSHQVSFTYTFREISDDLSVNRLRRIAEIKTSIFDRLDPHVQALIVLHEVLHHEEIGGHEVISPFIQALNTLSIVRARQASGDQADISKAEYKASIQFEALVKSLNHCEKMKSIESELGERCKPWQVNQRGGGAVLVNNLHSVGPKGSSGVASCVVSDEDKSGGDNYIGVDASAAFQVSNYKNTGLDEICAFPFHNNQVHDSVVVFDRLSNDDLCENNRFISINSADRQNTLHLYFASRRFMDTLTIECQGSANLLENINVDEFMALRHATIRLLKSDSDHQPPKSNHLKHIRIMGSLNLDIRGSNNVLEKWNLTGDPDNKYTCMGSLGGLTLSLDSDNYLEGFSGDLRGGQGRFRQQGDSCSSHFEPFEYKIGSNNRARDLRVFFDERSAKEYSTLMESNCSVPPASYFTTASPIQCQH